MLGFKRLADQRASWNFSERSRMRKGSITEGRVWLFSWQKNPQFTGIYVTLHIQFNVRQLKLDPRMWLRIDIDTRSCPTFLF